MKRAGVVGLAIVLTLGLTVGVGQAAKSKQVKTEAEVEGLRGADDPGVVEFFGDVHSQKTKCEKGRQVTLRILGSGDGTVVGTDATDKFGDWEITDETPMAGEYVVDVERKKIKKRGKDLTCKGTTSPAELIV